MESGNRDLETLTRNQTILLERIEAQITRLRGQHEDSTEESRRFFTDMRSFRRWMITMTIVIVVLLGATVGMLAFLIIHP
jgi:cell division septal protein FtsQ